MSKTVLLKIKRQEGINQPAYWDTFEVPYRKNMNVISALMEIQKKPVNVEGKSVSSVVWDSNCLEEVCGACSMRINGKAQQACSALVDNLKQPIVLEPMSTFPIERDLIINRERLFSGLKKVKAWVHIDGTHPLGPGPLISSEEQQKAYAFTTCMTCGVCLDVCPNVNERSSFAGPQPLAQAYLFNLHPTGKMQKKERMDAVISSEGIGGCGNSQNCIKSCPKDIPLTTALAELNGDANRHIFSKWFKG